MGTQCLTVTVQVKATPSSSQSAASRRVASASAEARERWLARISLGPRRKALGTGIFQGLRMRTYHPAVGHTPRTRTLHVQRVLLQLRICSREDDRFVKYWKYMFCQLCAAMYLSHSYVYWCTREM